MIKKILLTTRQPKKVRIMVVRAKFETNIIPKLQKLTGLFLFDNCVYHKAGYIIPCSSFSFKITNGKTVSWTYKNHFFCCSFLFSFYQGFLSRTLTTHRTAGEGRGPFLFHSTTSTRSQTFRHLCATLHVR